MPDVLSYEVVVSSTQFVGGLSVGTLVTQLCKYMGAAKPDLVIFPFYVGLLFSSFIVMNRESRKKKIHKHVAPTRHDASVKSGIATGSLHLNKLFQIAVVSLIRVSSTAFSILAINSCGSATYQLLYSSLPIFSAICNYLVYGRKTTMQQNMCLIVIMLGIYASTLGEASSINSVNIVKSGSNIKDHTNSGITLNNGDDLKVVNNDAFALKQKYHYGVFMSFMTVFSAALIGLASEAILSNHKYVQITVAHPLQVNRRRTAVDDEEKSHTNKVVVLPPPSRGIFIFYISIFCLFYLLMYIIIFTIPYWEKQVLEPIEAKGVDTVEVFGLYLIICIAGIAQNVGYFDAIMQKGVVFVGVISTLVTVVVFCCSSYFFCNVDIDQCGTLMKSMSCLVVVFGVLGYNLSDSENKSLKGDSNMLHDDTLSSEVHPS